MIETFKILSGKYDKDCTQRIFRMRSTDTRSNTKKIFNKYSRLDIRKYNFNFRVVNDWNSLLDWVVNDSNVLNFERKLDKFWKTQGRKFNYKSQIVFTTTTHGHSSENNLALELESQA